jgi:hypothetical protein
MADAALATMYETYSMACGLRKDGIPQLATFLEGLAKVPPIGPGTDVKPSAKVTGAPTPTIAPMKRRAYRRDQK